MSERLGIVAIGRNEGKRLERCLDSIGGHPSRVVYVDSGSTDGSPEMAREKGATVVELDMDRPFTMARGRNAGFERLLDLEPDVVYVQFVDGDCEVARGWLEEAVRLLDEHADVAAVGGRRRERSREASLYNRLTDMDWEGHPGETLFTGGDVMMRAAVFQAVGGYAAEMIAGEDPEICVRVREAGWKLWRTDAEMTLHDAAMHRFGQWWTRAVRSGHAYAEGAYLHRRSSERPWAAECRSGWLWGLWLPLLIAATAIVAGVWVLLLAMVYPVQVLRIARGRRRAFGNTWGDSLLYGAFCMLSKFAHAIGQTRFRWNRIMGRRTALIEYKEAGRD